MMYLYVKVGENTYNRARLKDLDSPNLYAMQDFAVIEMAKVDKPGPEHYYYVDEQGWYYYGSVMNTRGQHEAFLCTHCHLVVWHSIKGKVKTCLNCTHATEYVPS